MSRSSAPAPVSGQLSFLERALYIVGGLMLAAAGARPRPNAWLSVAALGAGGYLAWRGAEGSCPAKAALAELDTAPSRPAAHDPI